MRFYLLLLVFFCSCSTLFVGKEQSSRPEGIVQVETEEKCLIQPRLVIEVSKKGSRSETKNGFIYFGKYKMPDKFTFVQSRESSFCFSYNTKRLYDVGYFSCDKVVIRKNETVIDENEVLKGWYLGSTEKKGTPKCWIYIRWNGGSAFVNPDKAEDIFSMPPFSLIYDLNRFNHNFLN